MTSVQRVSSWRLGSNDLVLWCELRSMRCLALLTSFVCFGIWRGLCGGKDICRLCGGPFEVREIAVSLERAPVAGRHREWVDSNGDVYNTKVPFRTLSRRE